MRLCFRNLARTALAGACTTLLLSSVRTADAERLSQTVVPEHYDLKLTPDLKAATFTGEEQIDVVLMESSTTITLNSAEIEFQGVTVKAGGKEQTGTAATD